MNEEKEDVIPEASPNENIEFFSISDLDEDEQAAIRRMIESTFSETCTIDEAISRSIQEEVIREESFRVTKKNCKTVTNHINSNILRLELMKIESILLKAFCILTNNGRAELIDGIVDAIDSSQQELKNLVYLLKAIKRAIRVLEKYKTGACNLQLSELTQLLYDREMMIYEELDEYVNKCKLATKGIQYMGSNKNQVALKENDEKIENTVKALGLIKQTSSDK